MNLPEHIHGMQLDFRNSDSAMQFSAWPMTAPEYGVVRFGDGRWMVTLPGGCAVDDSFESALAKARIQQHEALWGKPAFWNRVPYSPNPSWTGPGGDAWIADGGTLD